MKNELGVVRDYINEIKEPRSYWPRQCFEQASYSKWAANEIFEQLCFEDYRTPIEVVEDFVDEMDRLSCVDQRTSIMFSIAKDAASNILDILAAAN